MRRSRRTRVKEIHRGTGKHRSRRPGGDGLEPRAQPRQPRGNTVAVYNRTYARAVALIAEHGEAGFVAVRTIEEFAASLAKPRTAIIMVQAGAGTDAVIDQLAEVFEPGDIIVDGGNAHFHDTIRREKAVREKGLNFVGAGISGGEEGALNGPSIMPGGSARRTRPSARSSNRSPQSSTACPAAPTSAPTAPGHFVKMVHNGIEYADMQLIAEAYDLLRQAAGKTPPRSPTSSPSGTRATSKAT